jgi:peptidoglycan/xylan/chitin deacetylase (PgdA/CDA1 family)
LVWAALALAGPGASMPAQASAPPVAPTVVSLTFDDGRASQIRVAWPILAAHGDVGTFYVNSGTVGLTGRMSWADLRALSAAGNEMGGHTTYHANLLAVPPDEAAREVCDDRFELAAQGLHPVSFAYPYSRHDAAIERQVASCGYTSCRIVGHVVPGPHCVVLHECSESLPPADPFAIRTPLGVRSTATLATVESYVTQAESQGGGWITLVFHDVCDCSGLFHTTPAIFSGLLDWLAGEVSRGAVRLATVGQVIGGSYATPILAPPGAPRTGPNLLLDPSLEDDPLDPQDGELAACWRHVAEGGGHAGWQRVTPGHTGAWAVAETVTTSRRAALHVLVSSQDLGACAVASGPGISYELSAWYRSDVPVILAAYARSGLLAWRDLARSPAFPAASQWTHAVWDFSVPPGSVDTTAVAAGAGIADVGSAQYDDFSLVQR